MTQSTHQESLTSGNNEAFQKAARFMQEGVEGGVFPGAVLAVSRHGNIKFAQAFGSKNARESRSGEPPAMRVDTAFDVAGLTSVMVTATVLMKLVEEGKVRLEERVSRYIQGFGVLGKSAVTIAQLATHTSGLPYWHPFFEELLSEQSGARRGILTSKGARDHIINTINRMELKHQPGTKQVQSDLGLILLGHLVEILTGLSLEKAAQHYVFRPLGLKNTSFIDLAMIKRRGIHPVTDMIAPTENCSWRQRVLCGEVHDDNAWVMGGIAGHAGVFTTVGDLHLFCGALLAAWRGGSDYLRSETLKSFWSRPEGFPEGSYKIWDSPTHENGMNECGLGLNAAGMNGFTGCSIWLDPDDGSCVILASNRVHPARGNRKILSFRPELHSLVLEALRS